MRTLTDPQSNQVVKQDIIPPKQTLKTKAVRRLKRVR